MDFYDDMENLVSCYKTENDEIIFCGDCNVHMNKPENYETARFTNITKSANVRQHVSGKTHIKGSTLDLVLTEDGSTVIKINVTD